MNDTAELTLASIENPETQAPLTRGWTIAVDRAICAIIEPAVAILMIVEIFILASGVFSRYVLQNALVWTDELATLLFLWLTMLGAAVAYRRGEHMRLTVLVRAVSPIVRARLDTVSTVIVLVFCVLVLPATAQLYQLQRIDLSPALNLPHSYDVAAILAGIGMIAVLAVLRLVNMPLARVAVTIAAAIAVCIGAELLHPVILAFGNVNLLLFFVLVLGVCLIIGVPIAFAFGFSALSYLALATSNPMTTLPGRMNDGVSNLILLAIPLFVLLGALIVNAGIARRLVNALASLVGHLRGGLNIVLVAAMYLVSGISGSKVADMAAVAPVLFPEMERRGQRRSEMVALLASSGAMAETIPPSLVLIIVGTIAGVSIRDLFTAGLLPAALCAAALIVVALVRSRGDVAPPARVPLRGIVRAFVVALPGLVLPFLIRFFVVAGIATATEVSTVGIIYSVLVGILVYRELRWRMVIPMLREAATLTGAIMLIIATATAMGWALTQSGFAQQLATVMQHAGGAAGFLAISVLLFVVLGAVLEGVPAIVLFGPLLFPIAQSFGINQVQYAIVAVLGMGIGLFAPPIGIGYYGACVIGRTPPDRAVRPILPYLAALVVALIVIAAIPWISTGFLKPALGG